MNYRYAGTLLILYALWNLYTMIVMGLDKHRAKLNRQRVSEKSLMTMAFAMGALGIYIGMHVFRHKTRHFKFTAGVPLLIVVNAMLVFLGYRLVQYLFHIF
ncbi:MAG: DUF1294 domain-containing protein [Desulfitobacteriaceae bacterium]